MINKKREHFFVTKRIVLLITFQLLGTLFFGLQKGYGENGLLTFFKNYTPGEYGNQPQNWDILQDKRGIIYVANQGGLLEFDGVSWKDIDIPNLTARSIAIDDSGTIYVGGKSEIGFLAPGENGALKYKSLVHHLADSSKNFGPVWRTHALKEGIYYWTSKFLFRWDPAARQMNVWETDTVYTASFSCNGRFYIRQQSAGLMEMINDSLVLPPGGETFARINPYMITPYGHDTGKLLIGTKSEGFYIMDGSAAVAFPTGADDYLEKNRLNHGIRLSSGDFALATRLGGLVILAPNGDLKEIFNTSSGLPGDNIWYVFEDLQGNLWLALDNGITKIEYASPFSIYDDKGSNLPGIVLCAAVAGPDRRIFAGTTHGLYSQAPGGKFIPVPGMSAVCWSLLPTGDSLLAATGQGVFQLTKNSRERIIETSSFVLSPSRKNASRIWVGTRWGLVSLYLENERKRWLEEYKFESIPEKIRTIVENEHGSLWLGTETGRAVNVEFPTAGGVTAPSVTRYGLEQGLPAGEVSVFWAADRVMFTTKKGVYRFDESKRVFSPDPIFGKRFADGSRSVFRIVEDNKGNTWIHSRRRNFLAAPQADGTYKINETPFLRLPRAQVNAIYPGPGGDTVWLATHNGLVRCDTRLKKKYGQDFPTLIRSVWINGKAVFNGYKPGYTYKTDNNRENPFPIIGYRDRNLRFEYAAPFFEAETGTTYRCFLEGYEGGWTGWNKETRKDYTNLDAGFYTFRVQAKNVYQVISREDTFQFKVLPPWYRTWWAYSIYLFLLLSVVYFIVKWRSLKLVREKQKLEQIIKERTKEINDQKRQLENQSEKLKEMDQVKSRFFANISHEFRTPLTLIMGPLEQLLSDYPDRKIQNTVNLALRNSQRLLALINQLLDLSKLDSGKMRLKAAPQDIMPFLKGIVGSFESLVVQEKLELSFHAEQEELFVYYDPGKLEKVIVNLVANAIKFTPAGGNVSVTAAASLAKDENHPPGYLEITVSDTGVGIPAGQMPYIFDRFYQAEGVFTHENKHKGSGIGLALVKELVELHRGDISVQSTQGQGTKFTIQLPLGSSHLKPGEIIDNAGKAGKTPPLDIARQVDAAHDHGHEPVSEEESEQEKDVILVVEDNPEVRRYIRGALESLYTVREAVDGKDGIGKARKIVPSLIVSDVMMPEVDGCELCKVLKTDVATSHIPIILLTARASEESIVEGLETGADDYIIKPFNTKILLTRIKNLIDLRSQLQEKIQREMTLRPTEIAVSSVDQQFMEELKQAIETNLSNPEYSIDDLAKSLYMARSTLNLKIRALTGESTNRFIQTYRLKRAAQLLKSKYGNVTEVAFAVGFSSSAYFTKCFKEKFHQVPSDFLGPGNP